MSELEPLPDELQRLFDSERVAPAAHPSARAGIRAKLAATVGKATLGHAAVGAGLGITGKTIVALAITVAVAAGGGVALVERHHAPIHTQAPPARLVVAPAPMPAPPPAPASVPDIVQPPAPPAPPAPLAIAHRAVAPTPPAPRLAEPALLRDAWAAVSAQQFARALELVHEDERANPTGPLTEEREALRVVALAKLGRLDDARAAASAFAARYPNSVHRVLVERAVHRDEAP
ncbi:MAG TPA: hypothetical protein VGL61_30140 [Kofleriaceae bacterium]|jgi:hypothetical protein